MTPAAKMAAPYMKAGWKIFPAYWSGERHIGYIEWGENSSSDMKQLELWSDKFPAAHYCVNLKASKLRVIDVDIKNDKCGDLTLKEIEDKYQELPETLTSKTPNGGIHYIFEGECASGVNRLGIGVDIPGMVPLPGQTVKGKGKYEIIHRKPPAKLPEWVTELAGDHKCKDVPQYDIEWDTQENIDSYKDYLINRAPEAIEGSGGDSTTRDVANVGWDYALTVDTITTLMFEHWNPDKASPPWSWEEIHKKAHGAHKYTVDAPGNKTVEAMFPDTEVRSTQSIRCASDIKLSTLKPRDWILGYRYLKGHVTLTIAPGGVGKSLLTILEGLSVASGRTLTYDKVKTQGAVWLYNTEDPFDELDNRIIAASKHHRLTKKDTKNFFYSSGYDNPLTFAKYDDKHRVVVNEKIVDSIILNIKKRNIILFIIDPLIECTRLKENDNDGMAVVMQTFRRIAAEANCAVSVVHHANKGVKDARGNVDKARGASAIANTARIAHTLYPMNTTEAKEYGLEEGKVNWYARLDDAKANLAPPGGGFKWFQKKSINLIAGSEETTGTLEPIMLEKIVKEDFDALLVEEVFRVMNIGDIVSISKLTKELKQSGFGEFKSPCERTIDRKIRKNFKNPVVRGGVVVRESTTKSETNGQLVSALEMLTAVNGS